MMPNKLSAFLLCAIISGYHATILTYESYDLLIPALTSTIDPEDISYQDQAFVNLCSALHHHGTKIDIAYDENWQAITSLKMFEEILPHIARTTTNAGYIALARMLTLFSDDMSTLQKNIALQQYFNQNLKTISDLSNICSASITAEAAFAHLFRTLTEEEIEQNKTIEAQFYFSKFGLQHCNEYAPLLEIGPRLNQCVTVATIAIPLIIASCIHKNIPVFADTQNQIAAIHKSHDIANESIRIKTLGVDFSNKKISHKTFCQQHKLDPKKSADEYNQEMIQKIAGVYKTKPPFLNFSQMQQNKAALPQCALLALYDGIKNLPYFTYEMISNAPHFIGHFIWDAINLKDYYNNKKYYSSSDPYASFKAATTTALDYASILYLVGLYPWIAYNRIQSTQSIMDNIYDKHQEIAQIAQLVKNLQILRVKIKQNSTLHTILKPEQKKLKELFDSTDLSTSEDLKYLITTLKSWPDIHDTSYYFSNIGKILATHHLLMRIKSELVPYFEIMGQIDAYVSIAKLYQEFKTNPNVKYCIPTFIQNDKPILNIQEYWHPLINSNQVVTNNLSMNSPDTANLIITGPNAGGKTTSLMSLMINIIFAQSFGIAPSKSLILTPFTKIHSYLDITTNLQEGLSLFAAEVDRAKKLKLSIMACSPDQKSFTIIDEILSGTDPKVAAEVGTRFATQLAEFNNSMAIITTHFPELTTLESTTGRFANFKVADAIILPDGSIQYPYKLIPGISSQNIATQMLTNQGII